MEGPTVVLGLPTAEHNADAARSHQGVITKLLLTVPARQTYKRNKLKITDQLFFLTEGNIINGFASTIRQQISSLKGLQIGLLNKIC
jgi:hypothetical protein